MDTNLAAESGPTTSDAYRESCIGCHVTNEEITRLKLDVNLMAGVLTPDGIKPICNRCSADINALTGIIADNLTAWSGREYGSASIIALMSMRDRLLVDRAVAKFESSLTSVKIDLEAQHISLRECRQALGLDRREHSSDRKRTLAGAILGAILGAVVAASKDPMTVLEAFANSVRDGVLKFRGFTVPVAVQHPMPGEDSAL